MDQKTWKRAEFLFCIIVIWTAALFQANGLYQEWREEQETIEAFRMLKVSEVSGVVRVRAVDWMEKSKAAELKKSEKDDIDVRTEFCFSCKSMDEMEELLRYKTKAERYMRSYGLSYDTYLCLEGTKKGRMSMEERKEVTDRLFHSLNAQEVASVREEELYTVYGYSPLLGNSISYGENEINLNLAFCYHEEEEKTMFYLAMPYVQKDY